jgi:superoxide reductase
MGVITQKFVKEGSMFIQKDDWKKEKHMPVIEAPAQVRAGETFQVKVSIGNEIAHPNTVEHHIAWVDLYFHPEGEKFPHQVGHCAFSAHGEAAASSNQGLVYTMPDVVVTMKASNAGTFQALAMCNIHGLWEGELALRVEAE